MTDLFEEVEEQLRSDRYRALVMKAAPWVLGLAAALLIGFLGYWGWQSWRQQAIAKAGDEYSAGLDALGAGQKEKSAQLWTEVSKSSSGVYKSLALMQLGGLKVADQKAKEAVALFDQAADAAPDNVVGDAARLKSALALLDTAPKEVEARLTPLTEDGRPYRVQAREALGFAKLMAGDVKGARSEFNVLSGSLDANEGARERAKAAIALIDSGSASAVPGIAKAQAALPPTLQVAPGQTNPGQAPGRAPQQPSDPSQAQGPQ